MERDIATAIDADELGAELAKAPRCREQVRLVASAADGVDREVLEQEQAVADASAAPLFRQLVLKLPRRLVGDCAERLDREHATVRCEQRMRVACRRISLLSGATPETPDLWLGGRDGDVAHE
jgi:hypothetical protein